MNNLGAAREVGTNCSHFGTFTTLHPNPPQSPLNRAGPPSAHPEKSVFNPAEHITLPGASQADMQDQPPVQRSFEHCYAPCLDNYPLTKGETPDDRGLFLVCVEFITNAAYSQRCVCAMASHFPWVSDLAKLFPRVTFHCFQSPEPDTYDPAKPQVNVRHAQGPPAIGSIDRPPHTPLLLVSLRENPAQQAVLYAALDPDRALLAIADPPQDFLSGTLYYPIYAPLSCPTAFLSVPHRAAQRIYDPRVLADELSFFHLVTRCSGHYDGQAETQILTDHAAKVLGYPRADSWNAVSYARGLVPR